MFFREIATYCCATLSFIIKIPLGKQHSSKATFTSQHSVLELKDRFQLTNKSREFPWAMLHFQVRCDAFSSGISTWPFSSIVMENCTLTGGHETSLKAAVIGIQLLGASLGCIGNLCVIVVYFKNNKLSRVTAFYIVNLAMTDFAICCILMPLSVAHELLFPKITTSFHIIHECLLSGLRFTSIATLVAISYDRMASATRPMRTSNTSSKRILCGIWTSSIPSFILPIFTLHSRSFHVDRKCDRTVEVFRIWDLAVFAVLCLVMLYNYRVLQSVAKNRASNLRIMMLQQTMSIGVPDAGSLSSQLNHQKKKVIKLSRMIMASVLLFWTPYLGLSFVTFFVGSSQPIETTSAILLTVGYLNHVLHPFLYALPSSNWREAARTTIPCLSSRSRPGSFTSSAKRQRRVAPS